MKTKKTYIRPTATEEAVLTEQFLADSGVSSDNGIGFGGVDVDGSLDADVKENNFEFEWE